MKQLLSRPLIPALAAVAGCRLVGAVLDVASLTDPGPGSLRAALGAAAPGDTVRITAPGVLTLAGGQLRIERDVAIEGPGPERLTLSGNQNTRIFRVSPGVHLRMRNLTVADGRHTQGAGLYNDRGTVEIEGCVFRSNVVVGDNGTWNTGLPGVGGWGGAVYNAGGLRVRDSMFTANRALGGQGGTGVLPLINDPDIISRNGGAGGPAGGGAVFNQGSLSLDRVLLAGNDATGGPGGDGASPTNWVRATRFPGRGGNGGEASGGAVFNAGAAAMVNVTLAFNSATGGDPGDRGIGYDTNSAPLYYASIGSSGNGSGGAIFNLGNLSLTNVTCATNAARLGLPQPAAGHVNTTHAPLRAGGLWTVDGATVLVNTLLSGNAPGSSGLSDGNCVGMARDAGHNLSSDDTPPLAGPGSANRVDIGLLPFEDNGGPTATFGLSRGSPAVDGGDDRQAPPTDQRDAPRPSGSASDIGACEFDRPVPLRILGQPQDCDVPADLVVFYLAVETSGYPPPRFQWFKDDLEIPGATQSVFARWLGNAADQGRYHVRVWNDLDAIDSEPADVRLVSSLPAAVECLNTASVGTNLTWSVMSWVYGETWFPQTNVAVEGACALQCTSTNWGAELNARCWSTGRVSFWFRSAAYGCQFNVTHDDAFKNGFIFPKTDDWTPYTVDVAPGDILMWANHPSFDSPDGGFTAWLDGVTFEPGFFPPEVVPSAAAQTVSAGDSITLVARATGTPPYAVRWYLNGHAIAGGTELLLSITNAQAPDAGTYRVEVENAAGFASSECSLSVSAAAPKFTLRPCDRVVDLGRAASFRAAFKGSEPMTNQWYFNDVPIPGATGLELAVTNVGPGQLGAYRLRTCNAVRCVDSGAIALMAAVPIEAALDTLGVDWTHFPSGCWSGQTNTTLDGVDAAWTTTGYDLGTNSLLATWIGPGTLRFSWRAVLDSYSTAQLKLRVDGATAAALAPKDATSLAGQWQLRQVLLGPGPHMLRWDLEVPYRPQTPSAVWLDRVELIAESIPLIAVVTPAAMTMPAGFDCRFQTTVEGTPPIALQWFHDSTPLPAATNGLFRIPAVSSADAGAYAVAASNPAGVFRSTPVVLDVTMSVPDAVDQPEWHWAITNEPRFHTQTEVTHDGTDALRVDALASGTSGGVLATSLAGPGTLGFWLKLRSTGALGGSVALAVDNSTLRTFSGDLDWQYVTIGIAAGSHEVRWTISHGSGAWQESEALYLDEVGFVPGGVPPLTNPLEPLVTVTNGFSATLSVQVAGTGPFEYAWSHAGRLVPWARSATLVLPEVRGSDDGQYAVRVRNEYGESTASVVLRVILPLDDSLDYPGAGFTGSWYGQVPISHDGFDAAQTGAITNGTSALSLYLQGPGTVTWWWKTACRPGLDRLDAAYAGSQQAAISGVTDWRQERMDLPETTIRKLLRWTYYRATPDDGAFNAAWVDQVVFQPGSTPPAFVIPPSSQSAFVGSDVTFEVKVAGTPPLTYLWSQGDLRLDLATTNTWLRLTNVTKNADYCLVVTNRFGAITNTFELRVHPAGTQPAPARIEVAAPASSGGFAMNILADTGWSYSIQTSTNLAVWAETDHVCIAAPAQRWQDPTPPGPGARFYRVVAP